MNILFVYPTLFHPQRGGVERVTDLLTREFIRRGHVVRYLHNKPDDSLMDYDYPGQIDFFPGWEWREPENVPFYHNFLRRYDVDVVINQCGNFEDSELYLNVPEGVRTISVLHNPPTLNYSYLASDILKLRDSSLKERVKLIARFVLYPKIKMDMLNRRRRHMDFLAHSSDCICLLSDRYREEALWLATNDETRSLLDYKLAAIPNPNTFEVCDAVPDKEKILLYVGRLDRGQKRPDRLLKIWRRIYRDYPDWRMVIVGDGPERPRLEKRAAGMERIEFTGYCDPTGWYRKASIFCMTSNFEGWSMALTEAMAYGTVPVAFESYPAVRDIIAEEDGILIEPFDLNSYAAQLRRLMDDAGLRHCMAMTGQQSIRRYTVSAVADQWVKLLNKLGTSVAEDPKDIVLKQTTDN